MAQKRYDINDMNESNRYAAQKNDQSWTATTREKLRCFEGFLYCTSINKISQIDDVCCSDWVVGNPAFARLFTRDRFWAIMANIHLAGNDLPKGHKDYDKLYKLTPNAKNCEIYIIIWDKRLVLMKQW